MVEQYPHYIYVKYLGGESFQNDEGNWEMTGPIWKVHGKGREETNGAGRQIIGTDGKAIVFSSVVYMPKGAEKITEGTEVLISESKTESVVGSEQGPVRIGGKCLKFSPGQL